MRYSEPQIKEAAKWILSSTKSKILCFYGEMGAGKTTLIKELVATLGGGNVSSPSFGIVNEYHISENEVLGFHFDFYRLNDENEALDIGFEDYLNQDVWIFIEWPEKIKSFLPEDCTKITIKLVDPLTREITLTNN